MHPIGYAAISDWFGHAVRRQCEGLLIVSTKTTTAFLWMSRNPEATPVHEWE